MLKLCFPFKRCCTRPIPSPVNISIGRDSNNQSKHSKEKRGNKPVGFLG
jgi:hypothetical protein